MQLFLDMDGVLANFDAHHKAVFGYLPTRENNGPNWAGIRSLPDFYVYMPPMPDMHLLWNATKYLYPIILTGVHSSGPTAPEQKTAWARKNISPDVSVLCCHGAEKYKHCRPGDILIDDWEKYQHLWIGAGGRWITHKSATESIDALTAILRQDLEINAPAALSGLVV